MEPDERFLDEILCGVSIVAEHASEANQRPAFCGVEFGDERVGIDHERRRGSDRALRPHDPSRSSRPHLGAAG